MKTQIKKSISLFLAVLMVLSCWVWVAPEKAEAANIETSSIYTVEFDLIISGTGSVINFNNASGDGIFYETISNDGYGTTKRYTHSDFAAFSNGGKDGTYPQKIVTSEFPYKISVTSTGGYLLGGSARVDIQNIKINGKLVFGTKKGHAPTGSGQTLTTEVFADYNADPYGTVPGHVGGEGPINWPKPRIYGFLDDTGVAPELSFDPIGKIKEKSQERKANFDITKYHCYNQYGVTISDPANLLELGAVCEVTSQSTHIANTRNSDDYVDDPNIYLKKDTDDTVVIEPGLQVSDPKGATGTTQYYLVRRYAFKDSWEGESISKASAPISIAYPKYDVTFIAGMNAGIYNATDKIGTGTYTTSNYHAGKINVPATNRTFADGNTFCGYWSKPQPVSGDARYYSKEENFAYPCSSADYESYTNAPGSKEEASGADDGTMVVILADGSKYYDAGREYDPTDVRTINCEDYIETWYGWWLADDITVSFYDIDGKYLKSEIVKYGQNYKVLTWPESKYKGSSYVSGAITARPVDGKWIHTNGDEVDAYSHIFDEDYDLILTPKTVNNFKKTYNIIFKNENGNNIDEINGVVYTKTYNYREVITVPENRSVPGAVSADQQYRYEFVGWSTEEPSVQGNNYHVLLEDADFDAYDTDNAIGIVENWLVREDATYYPVYRRYVKSYSVEFKYINAAGQQVSKIETVKYGDMLAAPISEIPYLYAMNGFGYEFANWRYTDASANGATFGYGNKIEFVAENIRMSDVALVGPNCIPIMIQATYKDPVLAAYTVAFRYKTDDGDTYTQIASVKHGAKIAKPVLNNLRPTSEYDNGEALVKFMNQWKVLEGAADNTVYTSEELRSFYPISNITFEAVYDNPEPFYTVTYVDGENDYSERVLVGSNLPAWIDNTTNAEYLPTKADNEEGSFKFIGWFDEKQTDKTCAATNGTKYDETSTVTSNLTLYPQFSFEPFTYTLTFLSPYSEVPLGTYPLIYGASTDYILAEVNMAARGYLDDETYRYEFLGWDKVVPAFCEGKDMTFMAIYKPVYKYYNVKWYNSVLVDGKWVADKTKSTVDGEEVETNLLATTLHTYESKLYPPSVALECLETPADGMVYAFAGWYYNDADGVAHKYERGMTITGEMEFYATFELSNRPVTVTTVVGQTEKTITVDYNSSADVIADPSSGFVDATNHNEFEGWYLDNTYTTKFEADKLTSNVKLYAKFTVSAHDFDNVEIKEVPTYYAAGEKLVWCSCDKAETQKTVAIDMLTDTVKPTGTIYLGTLGSWSSTDETGAAATDGDPVDIYANADTTVVITANDTGDVNDPYNPGGLGKGIKLIKAFVLPADIRVTAESYAAAQAVAYDVYKSVELDENGNEVISKELTNTANYTVKLGDLSVAKFDKDGNPEKDDKGNVVSQSLESGKTYIVYYYVIDKAGNQLNAKVRTAKFVYDSTAPEITVSGNNHTINNPSYITYCEKATVSNVEVGATLKINGVEKTLTSTSAAGLGSYTITFPADADEDVTEMSYIITVTDKAGNSKSNKIRLVKEHNVVDVVTPATCTEDGSKVTKCNLCGFVVKTEVIPATGHAVTVSETAATCVTNGSKAYACETCKLSVTIEENAIWADALDADNAVKFNDDVYVTKKEDGVLKYLVYALTDGNKTLIDDANGHVYAKNAAGEEVYTVIKEATCTAMGQKAIYCTVCNAIKGEIETIPVNESAHKLTNKKVVLAATCTENGKVYNVCKYNSGHLILAGELEKTGHDAQWIVVKEATCGEAGTMKQVCSKCNTEIVSETAFDWVEEKDGNYTYVYETDKEGNKTIVTDTVANFETGEVKTYYKIYRLPQTNRHNYEITETKATATTEGETTYKCKDCGYSKTIKVDKLVEYTVTFKNGTTGTDIKAAVGEGVTIAAPTKPATDKFNYTFVGWADEDGKIITLPLTMSKEVDGKVFTAQFKETAILYTHTFEVPTVYENGNYSGNKTIKTLVGAAGTEVKLSETPVFEVSETLGKQYAFEFIGWERIDAAKVVSDETTNNEASGKETSFIVAGDATFVAKFRAIPNKYQVTFYTSATKYIWSTPVTSGEKVAYGKVDDKGNAINPATTYDDDYHYTFSGKWYTDSTLETEFNFNTPITSNLRLYAGYDKSVHTYDESKNEVVQAATCTLPEKTKKVCSCGYETIVTTKDALDHDWDEGKTENGVTTYTCKRDASHTKTDDVQTFTVRFVNEDGTTLEKITNVVFGTKVKYSGGVPTQKATAQYTYTFSHWVDAFGTKYTTAQIEALSIEADYVFTAKYTATTNKYRVSYVDADNKTIQTGEYEYGAAIPAFTGTVPAKKENYTHHFVFASWTVSTSATVSGDTVIKPVYNAISHDYSEAIETKATCTASGKIVNKCSGCNAVEELTTTTPALGHTDIKADKTKVEHIIVEPDKANGNICTDTFTCTRCGEKIVKNIDTVELVIKVNDAEKKPAAPGAATVTITNKATGKTYKTNNDEKGEARFIVMANQEWTVAVTGETLPEGGYGTTIGKGQTSLELGENTTEEDKDDEVEKNDCSCSCHKNSFWGILYRFFQSILSKFRGGVIKCCDDPDPRYKK